MLIVENVEVILVDTEDNEVGVMEKMQVHQLGLLHRAFSIFIFNGYGEMLLQQRADQKYHNGGLWTNTCCSHPFPGETTLVAAQRRLRQEMGFSADLRKLFDFTYKATFENGLTEHEFDHVFIGKYDGVINPDPLEVKSFSYRNINLITSQVESSPNEFTPWFRIAFPRLVATVEQNLSL